MKIHQRYSENISIRAGENNETIVFGYAAKYNTRSKLLVENDKLFYEIIRSGAFIEGIANSRDVVMVLDHDKNELLARTKSNTLELRSDDTGLYFEFIMPNTTRGRDTLEMINRGDISELSFAFYLRNTDYKMSRLSDGSLLREISNFKSIKDVSLLQTDAAYPGTNVGVTAHEYEEIERNLDNNLDEYYNNLINKFNN